MVSIEGSPYGLNVHLPADKLGILDRCKAGGIGWVRIDLDWNSIEADKGKLRWEGAQKVVDRANLLGLEIFATLAYTPGWANGGQDKSHPPINVKDWERFVVEAVTRFHTEVKHWGMWNEPNLTGFFSSSCEDYMKQILIPGATAAKSVDGSCSVVGPELASFVEKGGKGNGLWCNWLREILQNSESRAAIDIISHHVYSWPRITRKWFFYDALEKDVFRQLDGQSYPFLDKWSESLKSIIDSCGASDKAVWITETGSAWDKWERSQDQGVREIGEIYPAFLSKMSSRSWIKKVFFYDAVDDLNASPPMCFGVLNDDSEFTARPAFDAYQRWIAAHPHQR